MVVSFVPAAWVQSSFEQYFACALYAPSFSLIPIPGLLDDHLLRFRDALQRRRSRATASGSDRGGQLIGQPPGSAALVDVMLQHQPYLQRHHHHHHQRQFGVPSDYEAAQRGANDDEGGSSSSAEEEEEADNINGSGDNDYGGATGAGWRSCWAAARGG